MMSLHFVLLLVAFIVLLLSALNVPAPRINLMALGLALWVLSLLVA